MDIIKINSILEKYNKKKITKKQFDIIKKEIGKDTFGSKEYIDTIYSLWNHEDDLIYFLELFEVIPSYSFLTPIEALINDKNISIFIEKINFLFKCSEMHKERILYFLNTDLLVSNKNKIFVENLDHGEIFNSIVASLGSTPILARRVHYEYLFKKKHEDVIIQSLYNSLTGDYNLSLNYEDKCYLRGLLKRINIQDPRLNLIIKRTSMTLIQRFVNFLKTKNH